MNSSSPLNSLKILIAGGGTGGHLYSGIAVAEYLKQQSADNSVLFVGTEYGLEKKIVPEAGFDLEFIQVSRLKGSGFKIRLKTLLGLPKAFKQARRLLKKFKPDLVLGIGGYASGPMVLAAYFSRIPTAIIEQNAYPGFTNRILGKFAKRVFIAFEGARRFFKPTKVRLVGNPVRLSLSETQVTSRQEGVFHLFILGGSQGASALNTAMIAALNDLEACKDKLKIFHQSGEKDFKHVQDIYEKLGFDAQVFDFSPDLSKYYQQADLVICRAGAGTVTELMLLAKPSILVPYPFAADDHQFYNAMELVNNNAGELIHNRELEGNRLADRISYYMLHPELLLQMSEQARSLAQPQAAEKISQACRELAHV